jgi:hypothetical protein
MDRHEENMKGNCYYVFKVTGLLQYLPQGAVESHNFGQQKKPICLQSNPQSLEYESEILTT